MEAIADRFDWFFYARVDNQVVPSPYQALWLSFWVKLSICGYFQYHRGFEKLKIKTQKMGIENGDFLIRYMRTKLIGLPHMIIT